MIEKHGTYHGRAIPAGQLKCACLPRSATTHSATKAMNPEKLELLVTRVMPYGKYKGRLIADLPGHYLNWFASQGFPPGEIGQLLALMHEIDHNGLKSLIEPLRKR
jgi:uncharacterized protein (DUF3820 family)